MAQFHLLLLPGAGKQSSLSRDLCLEITVCNGRALSGPFHSQAAGNLFYYLIFPPTSWKAANVLCSPWFPGPSSVANLGLARHLLLGLPGGGTTALGCLCPMRGIFQCPMDGWNQVLTSRNQSIRGGQRSPWASPG